jgi:hypothetical protein
MLAGRLAAQVVLSGHPRQSAVASHVASFLSDMGANSKSDLISQYGAVVGLGSLALAQSELWVSHIGSFLSSRDAFIRTAASDALFASCSRFTLSQFQTVLAPLLNSLEMNRTSPTATVALLRALCGHKPEVTSFVNFDGDDDDAAVVALTRIAYLLHDKDQTAFFLEIFGAIQRQRVKCIFFEFFQIILTILLLFIEF